MNCQSSYMYKNTNIMNKQAVPQDNCPPQFINFVFIPNFNSIDLTQFEVFYSREDTEHRYPIYRKMVGGDNADKLTLGGQITFFKIDEDLYNVGVIDRTRLGENNQTMYIDQERYGAIKPGTVTSNRYEYSFDNDAPFTGYAPFELFTINDIQGRINDKVTGLPSMRDLANGSDRWIVPIAGNDFKIGNNFTTYKGIWNVFNENDYSFLDTLQPQISNAVLSAKNQLDESWASSYNFGYQRGPAYISIPSNSPGYPSVYPMPIKYGDYPSLSEAENNCWLRDNANYTVSMCFPVCYGFIKDDDDNYYILTVSRDKGNDIVNFLLYNLSTIPTTSDIRLSKDQTNSSVITQDSNFSNRVKDTFPKLFFAAPISNFDDNGPDAEGPGDVYEDESNAGESVGGDSNIVDDVTPPDTTPNTNYENFIINNGIFGTYKLTEDNARNYIKTLRILHDSEWIPGELGDKCEVMANLIHENTLSLYMLPISIRDDDCEDVVFNVGTKGIRTVDVLGDFGQESSLDHTKLVKKLHAKYDYDLGTLSHYYDNFLDFAPYSSASMYIPYIGKVELPINLIQSTSLEEKRLGISFRIDRTNGDMLVLLTVNNIPVCRWTGNCAKSIPLLVTDNSGVLQNQLGRLTSAFTSGLNAIGSAATMNVPGAVSNIGGMFAASLAPGAPIKTSSHIVGAAPESGDIGWLDSQVCTIIVERPIWWKPYDYGELVGYPTKKIAKLASVEGFAKITDIHIRCKATESEKERLKNMLAEGCVF